MEGDVVPLGGEGELREDRVEGERDADLVLVEELRDHVDEGRDVVHAHLHLKIAASEVQADSQVFVVQVDRVAAVREVQVQHLDAVDRVDGGLQQKTVLADP